MKLPDLHNPKTQLALGGAGAVVVFALYRKHVAGAAANTNTVAAGGSLSDPVASAAFGASSLENSIVGDLQPQIDNLAGQLAGLKAQKPKPGPPGPQGKPGPPGPAPKPTGGKPPKPANPPINAHDYAAKIPLNNTPANEALTILGTVGAGGVFTGHNVGGGAPVYAVLPQYGFAVQDFTAKNLPAGTKLATLKQFAKRISGTTVTERL